MKQLVPFVQLVPPPRVTEPTEPMIMVLEPVVTMPLVRVSVPFTVSSVSSVTPAALLMVRLLNVEPLMVWTEVPFRVTVPDPAVKVPLFAQLPCSVMPLVPETARVVPELIVRSPPTVMDTLSVFVFPPPNVRLLNVGLLEPERVCAPDPFNEIVLVPAVRVPLSVKLPAMEWLKDPASSVVPDPMVRAPARVSAPASV